MHIYLGECTPLQMTIDEWNTLQQISFTYSRMHIYIGQLDPPPNDHKYMEFYYTEYLYLTAEYTYT